MASAVFQRAPALATLPSTTSQRRPRHPPRRRFALVRTRAWLATPPRIARWSTDPVSAYLVVARGGK